VQVAEGLSSPGHTLLGRHRVDENTS
jgi:hypothetical protein